MDSEINVWTKILIAGGRQVLIYKEYDEEYDSPHLVKCMLQNERITATVTHAYPNEDLQNEGFDKYDEQSALTMLKGIGLFIGDIPLDGG